jgi:prepilin-type N-terminal cleavage/methylation domain-containing protein
MKRLLGSKATRRPACGRNRSGFSASGSGTCGAFTLVEILAVMAMAAVLSALTLPAVFSLSNAGSLNQSVSDLSLTLNESRAYAMAHDTYVWVGFSPDTLNQDLTVDVVAGQTGEATDIGASSTYLAIAKPQCFNHVSLLSPGSASNLAGMDSSADDISTTSQSGSFQAMSAGKTLTFPYVIQFDPQGEASLNQTAGSSNWIQIRLQPARGATKETANEAGFQIATLTGQVSTFRP